MIVRGIAVLTVTIIAVYFGFLKVKWETFFGLIPEDDSVRLLSHELEDLDYSLLYQAYSAKGRNQRYFELFYRFLERQTIYDWHTANFQGRNNYCKTDSDVIFMHMKDDHMKNAQLKLGYNVQITVDSEYIVAANIFQDRNDVWN